MRVVLAVDWHRREPSGDLRLLCETTVIPTLDLLDSHPSLRLAVRAGGELLEWVESNEPELLDRFAAASDRIEWIATPWFDPFLALIPPQDRLAQIEEHIAFLTNHLPTRPRALWLTDQGWEPSFAETMRTAGLDHALVAPHVVPDGWPEPIATEYLGAAVTLLPTRTVSPGTIDQLMQELADIETHNPVGVGILEMQLPVGSLETFLDQVAAIEGARSTTLHDIVDDDRFRRVHLPVHAPWPDDPVTPMALLDDDPGVTVLYRKMLRLSRHCLHHPMPETVRSAVQRAQRRGLYLPTTGSRRRAALEDLIETQRQLDEVHQRGQAWTHVERIDWDADTRTEILVELPAQSWLLVPDDGSFWYFDDKPGRWPVDASPWCRPVGESAYRWMMDLHAPEPCDATSFPDALPMNEAARMRVTDEATDRGAVQITVASESVTKVFSAHARRLTVSYTLDGVQPGRFGPVLPIALDTARLRVDGGSWNPIENLVRLEGHRFRLAGTSGLDRRHGLLVTSRKPLEMFAGRRLTPDDPSSSCLLLWPHWPTSGSGSYEIVVEVEETS